MIDITRFPGVVKGRHCGDKLIPVNEGGGQENDKSAIFHRARIA